MSTPVDTPPAVEVISLSAIEELKTRSQWVLWKLEMRNGKLTKVPYNPYTLKKADSTDPTTWSSYQHAKQALQHNSGFNGIGFVFNNDFTGFDLDHCINEDGTIDAWAQAILDELLTYAEKSPSKTGIHGFVRGLLPEVTKKVTDRETGEVTFVTDRPGTKRGVKDAPHPQAAIEMYCQGRFFTVTEDHLEGTPTTIEDCQAQLTALHARITAPNKPMKPRQTQASRMPIDLSDSELLDLARQANNGAKFTALYDRGDISGYSSASEADMALCNHLAFWTGKDGSRMDSLFRHSGLMRDKWDEKRGTYSYGQKTIEAAIDRCTEAYTPTKHKGFIGAATTETPSGAAATDASGAGASKPPDVASVEANSTKPPKPAIVLGEQDYIIRDAALKALKDANSAEPTLFVQIASLSGIGKDTDGRAFIRQIGVHEIKNALTDAADFFRMKKIPNSDNSSLVPTSVPQPIAELILALAPDKWPFKSLEAIIECPVLRPDGTVLDTPGYDEATQLYYIPGSGMERCKVPTHPTMDDVEQAVALLKKPLHQFPYETAADYTNAIATPLTPIVRHFVKSDVQLCLTDATKQGTGKGLLGNYFSILATGKRSVPLNFPQREEEVSKVLGAKLMEGPSMIVLDNITRKLEGQSLDMFLTGKQAGVRPLGQSKIAQVKNNATWIATGNNITVSSDIARRSYRIRLVSLVSNPDERTDFEIDDLEEWAIEHRPELITAYLTIARAWIVAGKPKPKHVPTLGTFKNWANALGGILEYAGIEGFQGNREALKAESNIDEGQCEAFLLAWEQCYGAALTLGKKVAEDIKACLEEESEPAGSVAGSPKQLHAKTLAETLPDELKEALQEKPKTFGMKLAKWLEKRVKTPYGKDNIYIHRVKDSHTRINSYQVLRVVACSQNMPSVESNNPLDKDDDTKDIQICDMSAQTTRNYTQDKKLDDPESALIKDTSHSIDFTTNDDEGSVAGSPKQLHANPFIVDFCSQHDCSLRLREDGKIVISVPESMSNAEFASLAALVDAQESALKAALSVSV